MRRYLGIANAEIGIGRIVAHAILARSALNRRHPPKTPKDVVDKINADVNEALRQPELQDQLKKLYAGIFGGSVEKTSAYMREESTDGPR